MTRAATLRQALVYEPVELEFGTSGLRGLVKNITDLEAYVSVRAFLQFLVQAEDTKPPSPVYVAGDLRPSTEEIFVPVCRAIVDEGFSPVMLGRIPTPALLLYAMKHAAPSVMVTGSHIPFDGNGIKLNRASGEVRKADEQPIREAQNRLRAKEYDSPAATSMFDERGALRPAFRPVVPDTIDNAAAEYERRYTEAFPRQAFAGERILVYQHSAVGRDLLVSVLEALGATAIPAGRSDSFVPVDTEAVNDEMLRGIQRLVDENGGPAVDAVVSTDGDGDRPLVLGVEAGRVRFVPGDILGIVTADFVGAREIAVPISVNDAVDLHFEAQGITPVKTRIGSPYVIDAMRQVGWEANGGFLTAAPVSIPGGGVLEALPTRDALLPILAAFCASFGRGIPLHELFSRLPPRFGKSGLLREFPRDKALAILGRFSPHDASIVEARFDEPSSSIDGSLEEIRREVERWFTTRDGFGAVRWINWLDGVRICFDNGDIVHVRPSGNAPELRVYASAGTPERVEEIVRLGTAPDGILHQLEAAERFREAPRVLPLKCTVQHYQWGGYDFIPSLLGEDNPGRIPCAELWIGAHPAAPSWALVDERRVRLDRLVETAPAQILGARDAGRFKGKLPFLMKVLDARVMLSIQAHPSREHAAEGFAREEASGIPLDSPARMYRDENHKPEAHVALTELWMIHGFRPLEEIADILASLPELGRFMPDFGWRLRSAGTRRPAREKLLRDLYAAVMTMPQDRVDETLRPLIARLSAEDKDSPGYWALRAARELPLAGGHIDRGIVSIWLLNLLHLHPGEGTYQPAGTLHAYLEGTNVELMASSDNVLRGGLTPKSVDTEELLRIVSYADGRPPILSGRDTGEGVRVYETPAEEFLLERVQLAPGSRLPAGEKHSVESLIVIEGAVDLASRGQTLPLDRGRVALVPADIPYQLRAGATAALLFRARVPAESAAPRSRRSGRRTSRSPSRATS